MIQPHQILIVEPRRSMRTMLEMILTGEGLQIFAAATLRSALLQLRVLQPDLIILGAVNDAGSAVAVIRAISPARVLALDGAGSTAEPGADRNLAHPFSASELCAAVLGLLGESRQ